MRADGPGPLRAPWAVVWVLPVLACAGRTGPAPSDAPRTPELPAVSATGESCDDPLPLPMGRVLLGQTRGGGTRLEPGCASGDSPERIYRFEVRQRSHFRAVLQADFDAVLALREGCGYENAELLCNDDERPGQAQRSRVDTALPPGDYFLIVDGSRGMSGDFELFAFLEPIQRPGAACAQAVPLPFDETVRGSTLGVPDRFQATCGQGAKAGEHVYRLELEAPSRLRVWQQTEHDGVLYLRERCAEPTSELACNDDFRGAHRSLLTARLPAGTYYLFTDGLKKPQEGIYSLRAQRVPLEPTRETPQAVCAQAAALPLRSGVTEIDTFHAASHHGASCGGQGAPESVFALEVEVPSRLRARLREPEFNAALYLRSACTEPAQELACERQARVDRGRPPGQPPAQGLDLELPPGRHYLFVDGVADSDFGAALLEVDLTSLRELQARCAAGPQLTDGQVYEGHLEPGPDRFGASCGGESRGTEALYRLRLPRRAMVSLELESSFDAVLHVRRDCAARDSEVACNDDAGHSRRSSLHTLLDAGAYVVIVDGFDADALGPYRLEVGISDAP